MALAMEGDKRDLEAFECNDREVMRIDENASLKSNFAG